MKNRMRSGVMTVLMVMVLVFALPGGLGRPCFGAADPSTERYTYFENLPLFDPLTPLEANEMRITFMGSMIPLPVRLAQAEMSIFIEVGWVPNPSDP